MTGADYAAIQKRCRKFWGTELRGLLLDHQFDDFVQSVTLAVLEGRADDGTLGNVCRSVIRDMRRVEEREAAVKIQAAFEYGGNSVPARVEVPHFRGWGGKRPGAGRPKKA